MIETGVGHMKDRTEIKGTAEALVTVGQGQVQGWLQIEMGLDALSVGNMIILLGIVQLGKQEGKQNRYNKVQYGWWSNTITNPTDGHRSRQTDYYPSRDQRQFKLIKGEDDPTTFLPLGPKLGGNSKKSEVNKNGSIDKMII